MTTKKVILTLFQLLMLHVAFAQIDSVPLTDSTIVKTQAVPKNENIYKFTPAVDIPIIAVAGGWSGYAFTKIYDKDNSTIEDIATLDKNDIPKFDRWAAGMSNEAADNASDYLFYGSIPYTFSLFLDKRIRQDALKISALYLEAMSITGLLYTGSVYFVDRYRPETYDTSIPITDRTSPGYKNAFFAGHPALVATGTFFMASVYGSYHPESNYKYVFYGVAVAATGTTVYLRHIAGKHFPSDLLIGTTVGTLSGLLVPRLHKINAKDQRLGLYPFGDGKIRGITAVYKMY